MELSKDYYEAREQAIAWLNGKREFSQGVDILRKSGYKPYLTRTLSIRGDNPSSSEILLFEMRKMLKYWYDPQDPQHEDVVPDTSSDTDKSDEATERTDTVSEQDIASYPPVIAKIIHKFSELYKTRSQLHSELASLPEGNSDEVVSARHKIVVSIEGLSAYMDSLYRVKAAFETDGTIPADEELDRLFADPENMDSDSSGDDDEDTEDHSESDTTEVDTATIEQLKKMRASEASKLTRARNELLYQSRTVPADKKENPMPECPRRIKLTKKVERISALITRIDTRIAELC